MVEQEKNPMEDLNIPEISVENHKTLYRATILSTKRSAWIGLLLIFLPFLFLSGALMRNELAMASNFLTWFYDWVANDAPDSDTSIVSWIIRFVLVGGPLIAIAVNLLAILHVSYDKKIRELILGLKIRWLNISIILFCGLVFTIFFWVLLVENINHP